MSEQSSSSSRSPDTEAGAGAGEAETAPSVYQQISLGLSRNGGFTRFK